MIKTVKPPFLLKRGVCCSFSHSFFTIKIYTMKKVFALVFALGAMTAVFAQRGYDRRDESRDVILGQQNRSIYDNPRNGYSVRERDQQVQRIRREYDWRIESVRRDRYLRNGEKRRQIRFLENERDARISEVMRSYDRRNNGSYGRRY
jgi:hypothetical protein